MENTSLTEIAIRHGVTSEIPCGRSRPERLTVRWGDIYRFNTRPPTNFLAAENPSGRANAQGQGDPWYQP